MKRIHSVATLGIATAASAFVHCGDGTSCFVGTTKVATPRGLRRIDELAVGDEVFAWDLDAEQRVVRRLSAVHRSMAREVRHIKYASGRIGGVTPSHPVYVTDTASWVEVRSLRNDTPVLVWDVDSTRVETITEITATEAPEPRFEVFNLTVDGPESNYFADGVLVHNKSMYYDDPYRDAGLTDAGTFPLEDAATQDGNTTCSSIDYSQARSCSAPVDAGADAGDAATDAGDAGNRSNTRACKTSFDCAGVCCSCPVKDAGADADPDAGTSGGAFTAYACACGVCQVDQAMCSRMLAGDPTLCP